MNKKCLFCIEWHGKYTQCSHCYIVVVTFSAWNLYVNVTTLMG